MNNDEHMATLISQMSNAQLHIRQYLDNIVGDPPVQMVLDAKPVSLTSREYEILFLKFIGKSDYHTFKYIGKIHGNMAEQTAIRFKHQMFNKLKVYSNDELINAAISLNLINRIPESFIKKDI